MSKIKVVRIEPNKPPEVIEIDKSLEAMQQAVGGWIELIAFTKCDMYVNEDGISLKLPPNHLADAFARSQLAYSGRILQGHVLGTAFVCGRKDGEPGDVSQNIIDRIFALHTTLEGAKRVQL